MSRKIFATRPPISIGRPHWERRKIAFVRTNNSHHLNCDLARANTPYANTVMDISVLVSLLFRITVVHYSTARKLAIILQQWPLPFFTATRMKTCRERNLRRDIHGSIASHFEAGRGDPWYPNRCHNPMILVAHFPVWIEFRTRGTRCRITLW